ncbi:MAG TPA: YncE family protein [Terracidiphilus sp.]|nr:YncE family protein [Terracidiphilus sp.]
MRACRFAVPLACGLALCVIAPAQSTPKQALLVLSKTNHTLAIVNPKTLKVVARVPVGPDPHEVIASTDGRTAYVSNYGFGAYHTLARIDLIHHKQLAFIDLAPLRGPHGLDFVHGEVWFTAEGAKAIGRYNPATRKVDWIMGTGQNRTHMLHVFPDLKRIVTTNVASGTVTILDKTNGPAGLHGPPPGSPMGMGHARGGGPPPGPPGGDWNETVVKVGRGSEGFDVTPDGKEMWVANAQDGTISVIDLTEKKVVATLDADVPSANRLKFTLDGKLALVSLLGGPDLVILDVATRQVVKRLPIGHGAAGVLMDPDGKRVYVSCGPDNDVAVIDLKTLTVVGHVYPGGNPDGLAWAVQR